ncbi:MAG: cysteine desulfurase family protein [Johnsonella sp.]|nr:cysteine desulfurase family protein [Johnsonella sp.]
MKVYFDNAASTKVSEAAIEVMIKAMREDYANPSARHMMGVEAERYMKNAQEIIAKTLKAEPKEIIFTSGGTESNNMALITTAAAYSRAGKHIISTSIEHSAVYEPLGYLREQGFEISIIPVDSSGRADTETLKRELRADTILVSAMFVNNEIGALEPIEEIASIVHNYNPEILFHTDAIQAYGKYSICPKRMGIDLMSASAHKLHGPKGVGFLYASPRVKLRPLIYGGGQQRGLRSGTLNIPSIAGFAAAAKDAYEKLEENTEKMLRIKDYLIENLEKEEGIRINSQRGREGAPHILSVSVRGVRSEVLLHALEEYSIYIASGSACSSNHPGISGTLRGIGLDQELLGSTIRLSFCGENTMEEARYFVEVFDRLLPKLRKFS